MPVILTVVGVKEAQAALTRLREQVLAATEAAAVAAGHAAIPMVENRMHGPLPPKPGGSEPASRTGNLISSLTVEPFGRFGARLFPDGGTAPYARRIELGFTGTDSIGRHYNQPGYPYLRPGWHDAAPVIGRVFYEAWRDAITL